MAKAVQLHFLRQKPLALVLATAFVSFSGQAALAQTSTTVLPADGKVTKGLATISLPSATRMQIDQHTDRAILEWKSFSIGSDASVNFSQPSSSSIALNRVLGTNPSEIFGRLTANGQVFLTNPSGVLFAPGASVEVGGLFATTLSIADDDFLAGRYSFYKAGVGSGLIINAGNISAPNGYAALAGPQVRNDGFIVARLGSVALAAGDRVTLDMVGDGLINVSVDQSALNGSVVHRGTIEADGGRVILTARRASELLGTVVNTTGVIRATSLVERNGEIILGGDGAIVAGDVRAGTIKVDVKGSFSLRAGGSQDTLWASSDGQAIAAQALSLKTRDGRSVTLSNSGGDQAISVGAGGITLEVDADAGGSQIMNSGGRQNIETSGVLSVGGTAGNAGISQYGTGKQSVTAANISLLGRGGIDNLGSGEQQINVAGGTIRVTGGAGGRAGILSRGDQTINGDPFIVLTGGAGPTGEHAGILATGAGTRQTIHANTITLTGGSGPNALAHIRGDDQMITASGDILLSGGEGTGSPLARIGGWGSSPSSTTVINARDVVLTGGSAPGAEALIGWAAPSEPRPHLIAINASRNVNLNSGSAAGAQIGASSSFATPPSGDITVKAGFGIRLNGKTQPTAIRTLGTVTLDARSYVHETSNSFIMASALAVTSSAASLSGPNQLASFSFSPSYPSSYSSRVYLRNASPGLTLRSADIHNGYFYLAQDGDASFVTSGSFGWLEVNATGSVSVLGGSSANAPTEILSMQPMRIATGGDLRIAGGSGDGSFALLKGYSDVNLTVGGALRIDAGTGSGAFARLQTETRDSAINIYFPNLASGGYFVNDFEGATRRGLTGIFSGQGVAVPGHTLFITYGQ